MLRSLLSALEDVTLLVLPHGGQRTARHNAWRAATDLHVSTGYRWIEQVSVSLPGIFPAPAVAPAAATPPTSPTGPLAPTAPGRAAAPAAAPAAELVPAAAAHGPLALRSPGHPGGTGLPAPRESAPRPAAPRVAAARAATARPPRARTSPARGRAAATARS